MKPETRAIREAAKLLSEGRSHSYVLGWVKASVFTAKEARGIASVAQWQHATNKVQQA